MVNPSNYDNVNGFEIRYSRTNSSTFNGIRDEDFPFELRIRHLDPELIESLREKILEWLKS